MYEYILKVVTAGTASICPVYVTKTVVCTKQNAPCPNCWVCPVPQEYSMPQLLWVRLGYCCTGSSVRYRQHSIYCQVYLEYYSYRTDSNASIKYTASIPSICRQYQQYLRFVPTSMYFSANTHSFRTSWCYVCAHIHSNKAPNLLSTSSP